MRAIRKYFQKYWKYKIQQTKEELNTMKIGNDIYYVGVNDHQVDLFVGTVCSAKRNVLQLLCDQR